MFATLFGGLIGGIFRLVPELLTWLDRKDERKHELAMQDKAIEIQKLTGTQRLEEGAQAGNIAWDTGALSALTEAIKGQDAPIPGTGFFVSFANATSKLMRPLITLQWVIVLYPAVIVCGIVVALNGGANPMVAIIQSFGPSEKAIAASIINFWFLDRVLLTARK